MGNRAVIAASERANAPSIYLHWNGGVESVLGFLAAAKELGFRDPLGDEAYGMAYLQALTALYFGDGCGTGIGPLSSSDTDNGDNGLYILGKGFTIAKRKYVDDREAVITSRDLLPADAYRAKADGIASILVRRWKAAQAVTE